MPLRKTSVLVAALALMIGAAFVVRSTQPSATTTVTRQQATSQPMGTTGPAVTSRPVSTTGPVGRHRRPLPPAASDRVKERNRMVTTQITHPPDGRPRVKDPRVADAMRAVPRHVFIPPHLRRLAYADHPLSIGYQQTISQPYIVALMTEWLQLSPDTKVLEIGTGSGYQAAVLAHLTPHVYTIEIVKPLAERAERTLREQGYHEVRCRHGDGYHGWPEAAPFDAMIVTCAADELPEPLWNQLKPGGRIVIPVGPTHGLQRLVVITKTQDGQRKTETVIPVRFVPFTRNN